MTRLLIVAIALACLLGCNPPPPPRPVLPGDQVSITVGDRTLVAEVAFDGPSRRRGLMHRERLEEDEGMLFVFPARDNLSFWMRNTVIPLSIAFLDDDGKILQIANMRPKDLASTRSKYKVRYALEVNLGWFERAGLDVGSRLPDFRETVRPFHGR